MLRNVYDEEAGIFRLIKEENIVIDCQRQKLYSLPDITKGARIVRCAGNSISIIPVLPNSIIEFDCDFNSVFKFNGELPDSLQLLRCSYNLLVEIPVLPRNLLQLYCEYNQIESLEGVLNPALKILECRWNSLTELPDLPTKLTYLNCSFNQITVLPLLLPPNLITLSIEGNRIGVLPEMLPESLHYICFNDNPMILAYRGGIHIIRKTNSAYYYQLRSEIIGSAFE